MILNFAWNPIALKRSAFSKVAPKPHKPLGFLQYGQRSGLTVATFVGFGTLRKPRKMLRRRFEAWAIRVHSMKNPFTPERRFYAGNPDYGGPKLFKTRAEAKRNAAAQKQGEMI